MLSVPSILILAATVCGLIELVRSNGKSVIAWGVTLLGVALLLPYLPK